MEAQVAAAVSAPPPTIPEHMELYLKQLCGINGVSYSELAKERFVGIDDKKAINKIFFSDMPKVEVTGIKPAQKKALAEVFARGTVVKQAEKRLADTTRGYNEQLMYIEQKRASMVEAHNLLQRLRACDTLSFVEPVERLLAEGKVELTEVNNTAGYVDFTLKSPVVLKYKNEAQKLDIALDMGRYIIRVHIEGSRCYVKPFDNNIFVQRYYHPHVNTDGSVCLGNAEEAIRNAFMSQDIYKLVNTIILLLNEYNEVSPYQSINRFFDSKNWQHIGKRWFRLEGEIEELNNARRIYVFDDAYDEDNDVSEIRLEVSIGRNDNVNSPTVIGLIARDSQDLIKLKEIPEFWSDHISDREGV